MPVPTSHSGARSASGSVAGCIVTAVAPMPRPISPRPDAVISAGSKRRPRRPANGNRTSGIAVHGRVQTPAMTGLSWSTFARNWITRKKAPNIAKCSRNADALETEKRRSANSRIGSIGCALPSSTRTKAASRPSPAA
jgi:hypothetical protein